jgi:SAM-dependent methyltransferase
MDGPAYVAQEYWDRLLERRLDERGVAYPYLAIALNRAMYDAERDQAARLLGAHGIVPGPDARVLDVGSGTGIWIDFWRGRGVQDVTGLDLTEVAVAQLRERHPDATFVRADIGSAEHGLSGPYDLISAMSVLLHITDDERWRRALRTLGSLLAPGGHVLLIEPAVRHRWWGAPFGAGANSKARHLDQWRPALDQAGLEIVELRPATVLLANAVDTRTRFAFRALGAYWQALSMGIGPRERPGRIAAAVLGAADRPLRRRMPGGPTAKLMLLRRRG